MPSRHNLQPKKEENYATRHANGTGPFILVSQEPGVKTVCKVNPDWWDNPNKIHNVTEVIFTQISNDATRVAALLSGQVDMAYPIPVQDMKRVDSNAATRMMVAPGVHGGGNPKFKRLEYDPAASKKTSERGRLPGRV